MIRLQEYEAWLVTGSQDLYGAATLQQVAEHSQAIAAGLGESAHVPVRVQWKPVVTTPEAISELCLDANRETRCIGLVCWMHTFSPAKMWIGGLRSLHKPLVHLHTQFNREAPWSTIDMDFMNTNQSAHGGREFGHICSRLRTRRKLVVGHWQEERVAQAVGAWSRAAAARRDAETARIGRLGDNMRDVAVTEGDKVAAQIQLGYSVHGYGMGDLAAAMHETSDRDVDLLCEQYDSMFAMAPPLRAGGERRESLREAARIELGLRQFLADRRLVGFTDTFENLHGLTQLPGLPVQRLMADGYGFGAEGDWKAAALTRAAKVMAAGLAGGTSFMEDYTYHFADGESTCLGSHMLEICPSIAAGRPSCEIHPLSIGGKEDPVRLVFDAPAGPAVNATIVDLGHRFRMVVNEVDVAAPPQPMERLPVARALWKPRPDLATSAAAWILAGGSHHPTFSQALSTEHYEDFADICGIELLVIDGDAKLRDIKNEIRWNDATGVWPLYVRA